MSRFFRSFETSTPWRAARSRRSLSFITARSRSRLGGLGTTPFFARTSTKSSFEVQAPVSTARVGMRVLHEVAVPPLHLLFRGPASAEPRRVDPHALDPEDSQGRLDPAGLQGELPDVGLEGGGGRVRLDVEPRVAPADRGRLC